MKTYRLLQVRYNSNYKSIWDCLTVEPVSDINSGKTNDIIVAHKKLNADDDYFLIYGIKHDGPVLHLEHCQHCNVTRNDISFINSLQILLLRYHSVPDNYQKEIILVDGFGQRPNASAAYATTVLKDRFIVEKPFDPDTPVVGCAFWNNLLSYFSDKIDINVSRTPEGYTLKIFRKDWQYQNSHLAGATEVIQITDKMEQAGRLAQTVAMYSCYTKAREALLDIVREVEGCEIYGYMSRSYTFGNFERFNNATIIKTYNLQLIK